MTDLIEYIKFIGESYGIIDPDFIFNVSKFLVSNNWFGCLPVTDNNQLLLEDDLAEKIGDNVAMFCELYNTDEGGKTQYLIKRIAEFMPKTAKLFSKYIKVLLQPPAGAEAESEDGASDKPLESHTDPDAVDADAAEYHESSYV